MYVDYRNMRVLSVRSSGVVCLLVCLNLSLRLRASPALQHCGPLRYFMYLRHTLYVYIYEQYYS